jgi:cytochrome c-type biogenesis protein CcmE
MTGRYSGEMVEVKDGPSKTLPQGKSYKFVVGGLVVVVAIVWLIFSSAGGSFSYYLTVAELRAQGPSERVWRVSGIIVGESIDWNPRDLVLEFEMADASGQLPVVYHGPMPDMFRDGAEAVVEGKYGADGVFRAANLFLQCPSKYEEAATATAQSPR